MKLNNVRNRHLHWKGDHLILKDKSVCYLVKNENYEDHWHLKFYWRDEPTSEFFNIVNAKENARLYVLQKMSQSPREASYSDLND